jgi:DnaJ-class molecular chaperone
MKMENPHAGAPPAAGNDPDKWQVAPCAFCRGRGTDPFNQLSELSRCESCHGHGTLLVPRPHVRCSFCNGSGSDKTFRCPACRGAGVVAILPGPTTVCPDCGGRGSSGGLECLKCRGQGLVPASAVSVNKPRNAS